MFGEGLGERVEEVPAPDVARKGDLESPCGMSALTMRS